MNLAGNSGSPVLRENDHVSIGVHVYGGSPNSASVIGMYGNPFLDYVAAFDMHAEKIGLPGADSTPGVKYITVPTSKTPDTVKGPVDLTKSTYGVFNSKQGFTHESRAGKTPGPAHTSTEYGTFQSSGCHCHDRPAGNGNGNQERAVTLQTRAGNGYASHGSTMMIERPKGGRGSLPPSSMDEEGFMDFLKKGIKIGGPILNNVLGTALPIALGPLGGPISSLASIAIATAGKFAESGGAESGGLTNGPPVAPQGVAERAILAEAAFQAMMKMDHQTLAEEGFFGDMWKVAKRIAPVVGQVAPKVLEAIAQPALQLALQSVGNAQKGGGGAEGLDFGAQPHHKKSTHGHRGASSRRHGNAGLASSGAEAFLARFEAAAAEGEEGFFDDILGVAKKAISVAGPVLSTVAQHGLPLLQGFLTEADFGDAATSSSLSATLAGSMDGLQERAVLAEAALQAALNAPQHVLEEEGFFSFMADAVRTIAPLVKKVAPAVIKGVVPVVQGLLSGGGTEAALVAGGAARHGLRQTDHAGLRPFMLHGHGNGGHQNGAGKDAWKQLQDHHEAGGHGSEFLF